MTIVNKKAELDALRARREKECFPIVNRGRLWYNCLTVEQLSELDDWYFKWLDVTKTKTIPTKPDWLNKTLEREEILL